MKCLICKKTLTNPESLALGIGPDCRAKYAALVAAAGCSVERIEALAQLGNAEVNRWLHFANKAIAAGRRGDARDFLAAAEKASALITSQVPPAAPIAPALPVSREIRIEQEGETVVFCPPWKDAEFLSDFKKRVHKTYRRWNHRAFRWELQPADGQMVPFVAGILRRHFPGYKVSVQ